ncbi:MAG: DUF3298 and DUF4163 domain-containing protein [Deltaproteobacteria bacterium]|jgi:hypothetical protein|nr:DUF3298 and DUF4163 domain-containing protein [Deltaproteobacteria bacterium]
MIALVLALFISLLVPCSATAAPDALRLDGPQHPSVERAKPELLAPLAGFQDSPPDEQRFKDASIVKPNDSNDIDVHYPVFGKVLIDQDIALWAHRVVETFTKGLSHDYANPRQARNELRASYTVSYASPRSLTVTYEIWTYTGGIHGNNDIITLSYDVESGQRLLFEDLVVAPDTALERLADYCAKTLRTTLGEDLDEAMLKSGTAPELDNYSSFSLFPAGLRVHFQPYQVAPFVAGAQRVDVPLEIILDAGPHLSLWGKNRR